jgi:hypothetical protein
MTALARAAAFAVAILVAHTTAPVIAVAGDPSIVGVWKIVEAKGSMAKTNKGQIYTFEKDGKMNISKITKATYTFDGKVVTINFTKTMKFVADITFNGDDEMIYKLRNSNQVFTMKRQ